MTQLRGITGTAIIDFTDIGTDTIDSRPQTYLQMGLSRGVHHRKADDTPYLTRDNILDTTIVDTSGLGDYTTLTAAYDGTTSSYEKQRLYIMYPGTYENETQGLEPPAYSHTKALYPGTVTIKQSTIDGDGGTHASIISLEYSCKITGLRLLSTTADLYAMHGAPDLRTKIIITDCVMINTGAGNGRSMSGDVSGNVLWFINCKFISSGTVANLRMHTKGVDNVAPLTTTTSMIMDLRFINCTAGYGLALNSFGGDGNQYIRLENCDFPIVTMSTSRQNKSTDLIFHPANNNEWIITGGNNRIAFNLGTAVGATGEALALTADNYNEDITISGSAVVPLFGDYKTVVSDDRVYGRIIGYGDVRDYQNIQGGDSLDIIQMWTRLGDCSGTNKKLYVTVGGTQDSMIFDQDYTAAENSDPSIIVTVNSELTNNVTMEKFNRFATYEKIKLESKRTVICNDATGIITGELVYAPNAYGTLVAAEATYFDVTGIALNDAAYGEELDIWTGYYFNSAFSNGEYGVGASNTLSSSATVKVGYVRNDVFYPYYKK